MSIIDGEGDVDSTVEHQLSRLPRDEILRLLHVYEQPPLAGEQDGQGEILPTAPFCSGPVVRPVL